MSIRFFLFLFFLIVLSAILMAVESQELLQTICMYTDKSDMTYSVVSHQNNSKSVAILYIYTLFIILLIIFFFIMLFKKGKIINEKENEIIKLKDEVDNKNRELTTKFIELKEKETIIEDIIQKLSQIDPMNMDKCNIKELLSSLKSGQSCHNWHEFEVCFGLTHPDFYTKLYNYFPKLTVNDKKLCAFIKLNFSTKEISILTGKNTNTIDVGRSRLRRKLGMSSDENLQSFIAHYN